MENYISIVQVLLAVFFTIPGVMKLITSKDALVAKGNMPPNGSISFIRFLGISEVLGALVMVGSILFKGFNLLTALAALGFSIVMIAAFFVHYKKKEFKKLPILVVALVLSLIVAYYNF